jgi:fatty acid desaturase
MGVVKLFGHDVDTSEWENRHPGGKKLLRIFENRDATQQFLAIHKGDVARQMLKSLPQKASSPPNYNDAEKEFNELIVTLRPALSQVNYLYEGVKLLYVTSFFFGGYLLCFSSLSKYWGLCMMCLAMYQAGWVGHDYSHRSILRDAKSNNAVADFLGCFVQGYTDGWWKARHNTHHMTTNEIGNDPDVKTEPVFHFYDRTKSPSRTHMPLQHIFFTVLLSLLDIFWRYESIQHLMKKDPSGKNTFVAARLSVHYLMLGSLLLFSPVTISDLCLLSLTGGL